MSVEKCKKSLRFWKNKDWINSIDPYGWFQWYFRYWLDRITLDDKTQVTKRKGIVSSFIIAKEDISILTVVVRKTELNIILKIGREKEKKKKAINERKSKKQVQRFVKRRSKKRIWKKQVYQIWKKCQLIICYRNEILTFCTVWKIKSLGNQLL